MTVFEELKARGEAVTYEQVLEDVVQRDYNDTHREAAPLKAAPDAVTVDTTGLTFDESFEALLRVIRARVEA